MPLHAMITTLSCLSTTSAAAIAAAPSLIDFFNSLLVDFMVLLSRNNPDYYYYYCSWQEHRLYQLVRSTPMADNEGSVPLRGVQWAFIGSPRAKKHVFAEMLSKLLEFPHISMATLVRQELRPHSNLYKQLIMVSLSRRILFSDCCRRGWKMGITEVKLVLFWMEFLDHGFWMKPDVQPIVFSTNLPRSILL